MDPSQIVHPDIRRWSLHSTSIELPVPEHLPNALGTLPQDRRSWLTKAGIPEGTPFLLSPTLEYDFHLNRFFYAAEMLASSPHTRLAYARDLAGFLTFLESSRGVRDWRNANSQDHEAHLIWRRLDPTGPRVDSATSDREITAINRFFEWQVGAGNLATNPIPQRSSRARRWDTSRSNSPKKVPATLSHGARRSVVSWLPAASYRRWRDVGILGLDPDGLPSSHFRGRWAERNGTYCDLMVRTGLRLSEQSALTSFEISNTRHTPGYERFWLPKAISKNGSARWVYVPRSVAVDIDSYLRFDRSQIVLAAQSRGQYSAKKYDLVVQDPGVPMARQVGTGGAIKVGQLTPRERGRLLAEGPNGLEPAALWLSEGGWPVSASTWQSIFRDANARCHRADVALRAHPHMLRHTFAVVTLEQLQRGHIDSLRDLVPAQRQHYTRIFGDPLDWVRRRLGHRSVVTTQIYLHTLEDLEMETRMALVPDEWDAPPPESLDGPSEGKS